MDDCTGGLDELLGAFSLDVARDSAWEAAVALANARSPTERHLVSTLVRSRAAVLARLLLAATHNPAVTAACSSVEQGTAWLAVTDCIRG